MINDLVVPCMEPRRCFLTSQAHGQRLSATKQSDSFRLRTSEKRDLAEEWLILSDGALAKSGLKNKQDVHYLCVSNTGVIFTHEHPNEDQKCYMGLVDSSRAGGRFSCNLIGGGGHAIGCAADGTLNTFASSSSSENLVWTIELTSGELCFISSHSADRRIRCNMFGSLSLTEKWRGWEVWRFAEVGDGSVVISSWPHTNRVLCSDSDGNVYTTENTRGEWERWVVERSFSPKRRVWIRSVSHNRLLVVDYQKGLHTELDAGAFQSSRSLWELDAAHRSIFRLVNNGPRRSIVTGGGGAGVAKRHDRNVLNVADAKSGEIQASATPTKFHKWKFLSRGDGSYSIHPVGGSGPNTSKSLGWSKDGTIVLNQTGTWYIHDEPECGGIVISGDADQTMVLSCLGTKVAVVPVTKYGSESVEIWSIEPCLPPVKTASQIWAMVGAGAVGLSAMVLAPYAAVGAVGALGFTSEGILASTAAAMMSAGATAQGGGVAAGGTVATLQSTGAGLGFSGTCAASGAGALAGAAVVGATGATVSRTSKSDERAADDRFANRPFVAWRQWSGCGACGCGYCSERRAQS